MILSKTLVLKLFTILVTSNDTAFVNRFELIEIDSSREAKIEMKLPNNEPIGLYYDNGDLGFYNSEADTFRISENQILVIINPFPDITLENESRINLKNKIDEKSYALGIKNYCYTFNYDGTLASFAKNHSNGTASIIHLDDLNRTYLIEIFDDGKLISSEHIKYND